MNKFADDTKLSAKFYTVEEWDAIQTHQNRLRECAHKYQMRFNKAKTKVLHW